MRNESHGISQSAGEQRARCLQRSSPSAQPPPQPQSKPPPFAATATHAPPARAATSTGAQRFEPAHANGHTGATSSGVSKATTAAADNAARSSSTSARQLRLDGNAAFLDKDYARAEALYTDAMLRLAASPEGTDQERHVQRAKMLNNRAACKLATVRGPAPLTCKGMRSSRI